MKPHAAAERAATDCARLRSIGAGSLERWAEQITAEYAPLVEAAQAYLDDPTVNHGMDLQAAIDVVTGEQDTPGQQALIETATESQDGAGE